VTLTVPTPPRPRLRAGDVVVLLGTQEYVEGEVITVLAGSRYKVKWTMGRSYRDRVATANADAVRKKS
jgi:hypothetical protein